MEGTIGEGIVDHRRDALTGVNGWLTFFCIGLGIRAAVCVVAVARDFVTYPSGGVDAFSTGYLAVVGVLAVADLALILNRRRFGKYLAIFICGLTALMSGLDIAVAIFGVASIPISEAAGDARNLIVGLAWLGYFLRSERVIYTLVK